jgi:transposase
VASQFYCWRKAGIWERLFAVIPQQANARDQLDRNLHVVNGTVVRAHQHAAGAKKGVQTPKP